MATVGASLATVGAWQFGSRQVPLVDPLGGGVRAFLASSTAETGDGEFPVRHGLRMGVRRAAHGEQALVVLAPIQFTKPACGLLVACCCVAAPGLPDGEYWKTHVTAYVARYSVRPTCRCPSPAGILRLP